MVPNSVQALSRHKRTLLSDHRIGFGLAAVIAALAGLLVALMMPHGPATAAQALSVMGLSLVVGLAAGVALRSRLAMLLAPLVHIAVLELARINVVGPTVDAPRFDEMYGIMAFVLGRGFYLLVGVLPMMLGAGLGVTYARRASGSNARAGRVLTILRWTPATLTMLALAALAVFIAMPASTPPILGADGKPMPGSIAELATVRIGGHDQTMLIRGYSVDNPLLLYLSGGPGQSDMPFPRAVFEELTRDVTFVSWDQRGTGKSYAALDPTSTLTLDQAVTDTIEVTEYLRQRFGEEKVYILGESWGTVLGVLAMQRRPDLYYAYIGSGQMVSPRETDRRLYHDVLAYAARTGDDALAAKMRSYGEPPYRDIYGYAFVMGYYDALAGVFAPPQAYEERLGATGLGFFGIQGSEYNLVEKINVIRGLIDMFSVMYPQIQGVDFRRDVPRLDVPVYVFDAQHELTSRRDLALEWYNMVQAPRKRIYTFADASHAVAFEQFEAFTKVMTQTIIPETQ